MATDLPSQPDDRTALCRRAFLRGTGMGVGSLALGSLLEGEARGAAALPLLHHAPKAKRVIFIHMVGAPSQLDLFDYKPKLQEYDRKPAPDEFVEGKRFAFLRGHPKLLGTPFAFRQHGQGGAWLSELLPHLGGVSDEICFLKGMRTKEFNHAPAQFLFHTGLNRQGNPSLGAWTQYGLGSPCQNLPGYVVFVTGPLPGGGAALWGNGFLPSIHQGVEFRSKGEPVLFLNNPEGMDAAERRRIIGGINSLNARYHEKSADPEILTRIEQYEMAFKMQASVPDLMDLSGEPAAIRQMYGEGEFASHCLYARRLAERGVRFIELFNGDWDTHGSQASRLRGLCGAVDRPIAALIRDLKQRGMLGETLVVWGAEFGRTPMLQGDESPKNCGRDHHRDAYTIWMAGGGVKGGHSRGTTCDLGYSVEENPTEIRDFHAALLHLLGIDHERLTFRYLGLDQRLTGIEEAHLPRDIFA